MRLLYSTTAVRDNPVSRRARNRTINFKDAVKNAESQEAGL
jgi:hypothetical protein